MATIEETLLQARRDGRKAFVPYLTGGLDDTWLHSVAAAAECGADAMEIGIPFSDPVMDGPTIQAANDQALARGVTPTSILNELRGFDTEIPTAVMTYYNIAYHMGLERFASELLDAGVSGAILPDLPLNESDDWVQCADTAGIETIMFAAPTTPDARLAPIAERARGFVYAVGLLGITGERDELAASALEIARRVKAVTERPVLVGVGVSTPEQAVEACSVADGVVVGSAIVRAMQESGPSGVAKLVTAFRQALDAG